MEGRIINNDVQSHGNQMNTQLHSMNVQATSLDSTAQTGHGDGGDWQEEVYQKIKAMKESYLPELNEMYQKIAAKLQQHDSLPHQPISDQVQKLKLFKTMLERAITFLHVSKTSILPGYKDKLASYEKQIISFINTNRPRKPVASLQLGQPPSSHMHSVQQSQSQITQVQSHENQMNPQLQSMNVQGSVTTIQQNNITNMQQNSMSALSGISTAQLRQQQFHQQQMQLLQQQQLLQRQQQQLLQQQQQQQAKQQIPGQMQTHENQMNPQWQILQSQQLHQQQQQQQLQQQLQSQSQSQSQSQITQVQSQLQSMNIQGSLTTWIQDKEIH